MKNRNSIIEITILIITVAPLVYLAAIWNTLPQKVPTHFNGIGVADDYNEKIFLIRTFVPLIAFMYFVPLFKKLRFIGKKVEQKTKEYQMLRLAIAVFVSALSTCCIYLSKTG